MIRVVDADAKPKEFRLASGSCTLGSEPVNDIVVNDPTVSRRHARIELVPEGVRVTDLGSRNGTTYLGQQFGSMVLSLGARIRISAATVAIEPDAESFDRDEVYDGTEYRGLLGVSIAMRQLFAMLQQLEGSLATVLIEGESGSGKERVARAIHEGSLVANGPLVTLNCGAIPQYLVASELFGHRRGAFTGALDHRRGAFDSADGGTLFLDEIGELPLDVQPALLRALESGEIRTVGDDRTRTVKVRVIAATNRDLRAEVAASRFREDLFYRLAVVRIHVPPLRRRPEDVVLLAEQFAREVGVDAISPEMLEQLKARTWRGNARELRNAMMSFRAVGSLPTLDNIEIVEPSNALEGMLDFSKPYGALKEDLVDHFTKIYLRALLKRTRGNQTAAARIAGLDRSYLGRLLTKYGIAIRRID